MECPICGQPMRAFAVGRMLKRYDVDYFACAVCGFTRTEEPYWMEEAYSDAISAFDVGLVERNLDLARRTRGFISLCLDTDASFLDYGAGAGLFVRLMRDRGYDFKWFDPHAKNIFARGAEHESLSRYELVTAFEVLEHLSDPMPHLEEMIRLSDNVLFTQVLIESPPPAPDAWWYYSTETGQHVSFYSWQTLQAIAKRLNMKLLGHRGLFLLTRRNIKGRIFQLASHPLAGQIAGLLRGPRSFVETDYKQLIG